VNQADQERPGGPGASTHHQPEAAASVEGGKLKLSMLAAQAMQEEKALPG